MKRYFFLLFASPYFAFSQSAIVKRCLPLIAEQKFDNANFIIDSLLRINPNETDAWMMKGNTVLNQHLVFLKSKPIITALDENILSEESYGLNNPPQIPTKQVADSVEQFWKKVLLVDSTREDVQMGLCTLFGMSMQTEKLIHRLPTLKKVSKKGEQLAYLMEDYARMLRERGKTEEANKVFSAIVKLYPTLSGIRSDWGGEFLLNDDLKTASTKADEALGLGHIDEPTRENLTDIFLFSKQPAKAVKTIESYSKTDSTYLYSDLYKALYSYATRDSLWKQKTMKALENPKLMNDTNQVTQICRLLTTSIYTDKNFDILMAVLSTPINTFCSWAMISRAVTNFPDSANIQLIAAEFYLNGKNFTAANLIFKNSSALKIDEQTREDVNMVYAFSAYKAGDKLTAKKLFSQFEKDSNMFKRQASKYFLAKMETAPNGLLQELSEESKKTKYAYFADILLGYWK